MQNKFCDKPKTKISEFYYKKTELEKNSEFVVLSNGDIKNLFAIYNDLGFEKINGPYNQNQHCEPELYHLAYDIEIDFYE